MVVLVVVLAIVLLLVAKQWKSVAPTAMQIDENNNITVDPPTHGEHEAGEALRQGNLPDLNQMRQATGNHAQDVQEALAEIE